MGATKTFNVIGCGNVGQTLAHLLATSGACQVQDLKGSSLRQARIAAGFIGGGRAVEELAQMRPADVWLVAVPDSQTGVVAAELAQALAEAPAQHAAAIAFHCSGFLPASTLAPLREHGFQLASLHPVLAFADPATAVARFPGTPVGLEGDDAAMRALEPLLEAIGAQCFAVPTGHKPLYHAAAVFSSNFTVVLQAIACEAWTSAGVPASLVPRIQAALLQATTDNVVQLGPGAITGPAARGDREVVRIQGAEVQRWQEEAGTLYQALSRLARRVALRGRPFARRPVETE